MQERLVVEELGELLEETLDKLDTYCRSRKLLPMASRILMLLAFVTNKLPPVKLSVQRCRSERCIRSTVLA